MPGCRREGRIGGHRTAYGDAVSAQAFERRLDEVYFLAADMTLFARVRIEPADDDVRILDPEFLPQVGVQDVFPTVMRLGTEPNPFTPSTQLQFALPRDVPVWLTIYDARGRAVRRFLRGEHVSAGDHARVWVGRDDNGRRLPSGVYFARLRTDRQVISRKITLLR